MTNEERARNIASQWCRCFNCDGIIRDTRNKCNKDGMITCHQWYHSYRAAKLACKEKDQQFKEYLEKKLVDISKENCCGPYGVGYNLGEKWAINDVINELFGK